MITPLRRVAHPVIALLLASGCGEMSWPWFGQEQRPQTPPSAAAPASAEQASVSPESQHQPPVSAAPARRPEGPWLGSEILLVNGEEITVEEVLDPIRTQLERAAETVSYAQYRQEVQRLVGQQIWRLVNELLVYRDAKSLLNEQVEAALTKEVDRLIDERINNEFEGRRARFESHLAELGMPMERVRELLRRQILVSEYLRQRLANAVPEPGRDELYAYYQQRLSEYRRPARAELFLIDIPVDAYLDEADASGEAGARIEARRKARAAAERAAQEIASGIDFRAVARTYSKGIKAAEGGAWGIITAPGLRGRYAEPSRRAFELEPGRCSEIIDAGDAFFIVKAGEVIPAHTVSFEEAQPQIRSALRAARLRELESEYLTELREKADIQRWDQFKREVIERLPRPPAEAAGPLEPGRP